MFDDLGHTASLAEIAWTALAAIAATINVWLLADAARDVRAVRRAAQNGARRIAGHTALGIQIGLTLPQVLALCLGLIALDLPPSMRTGDDARAATILVLGLTLNQLILAGVGVFMRIRRALLLAYLERRDRQVITVVGAERHAESMAELVHNTEITTEARDGALEAYHAANDVNNRIIGVQQEIAATNEVAGKAASSLKEYMEKLETERQDREGC